MADRVPAYVAHQLNARTATLRELNRQRAQRWVAWLADRYLLAPVADWILLAGEWPETPERRAKGLEIDRVLVELCGRLILCGPLVSDGMALESSWAARTVDLATGYGLREPPADGWHLIDEFDSRMLVVGIRRAA